MMALAGLGVPTMISGKIGGDEFGRTYDEHVSGDVSGVCHHGSGRRDAARFLYYKREPPPLVVVHQLSELVGMRAVPVYLLERTGLFPPAPPLGGLMEATTFGGGRSLHGVNVGHGVAEGGDPAGD